MTIFEQSQKGQKAYSLPKSDPEFEKYTPPESFLRKGKIALPEISEIDLTRHFSNLARKNMGIDTHFYPLGSCTMKLNPRVNEVCANMPDFIRTHPMADDSLVQGNLRVAYELIEDLCKVSGMSGGSVLPNAGAQGEFMGILMIKAYHKKNGDTQRTQMLIPDSAHGTNPATAAMAGFETVSVPTDDRGDIDLDALKKLVSEKTAGLMLTNPNTLGLFSPNIQEIAKTVHDCGALLFYDGANLNAILNVIRPGEMGFDVMHINLHKTFSTPHGGGGPGSGPVLCNDRLKPFLPLPRVDLEGEKYKIQWESPDSVGAVASFHGNFGIYLRAYLYIKLHGHFGLRRIAENAVLNANYLKKKLEPLFTVPYKQNCMHEFVIQADGYLSVGVRALDVAKRLLDYGVHAPTIYFPLIVKECMLIEPTESESKKTLDQFIVIIEEIVKEIQIDPEILRKAPHSMSVKRLDEVQAVKKPVLKVECCM
ncbi:MAG: glycine dehydrogenase subunit 2 [Chlamydiales bacterium]|jgi:glycine dehydrogenase subunit 2